ncbi:MAG TPA: protein phosphatase 2C domain-containing protein [Gemmatimonadaceae bacterium]|nr:protein phosphatase 2C domain-containing protein [Gemmatimonadaceae bacterium]
MTDIATTLHHASTQRRPRDDEIDSYGVTHPGKVRPDNQDHFLIGRLRGRLDIRVSSLPDADRLPIEEERVGSIMMVADGVGGGLKGEKASRIALEEITQYISEAARCYYRDNDGDQDFMHALERAACIVHEKVVEQAAGDPEAEGMATTLTLFIGVWPWTYLLQVGDSRYYRFADGVLSQVSHDQTLAQALVDQGIMSQKLSANSPLSNVLTSSIGGAQTAPAVTRLPNQWGVVHLLCTDGLTRHVSDDRISERLASMQSARQVCEDLLHDALDAGGTDNITVLVGRTLLRDN